MSLVLYIQIYCPSTKFNRAQSAVFSMSYGEVVQAKHKPRHRRIKQMKTILNLLWLLALTFATLASATVQVPGAALKQAPADFNVRSYTGQWSIHYTSSDMRDKDGEYLILALERKSDDAILVFTINNPAVRIAGLRLADEVQISEGPDSGQAKVKLLVKGEEIYNFSQSPSHIGKKAATPAPAEGQTDLSGRWSVFAKGTRDIEGGAQRMVVISLNRDTTVLVIPCVDQRVRANLFKLADYAEILLPVGEKGGIRTLALYKGGTEIYRATVDISTQKEVK